MIGRRRRPAADFAAEIQAHVIGRGLLARR